jgi:hypothetical protein
MFALLEMTWEAFSGPTDTLITDFSALFEVGRGVELTKSDISALRKVRGGKVLGTGRVPEALWACLRMR